MNKSITGAGARERAWQLLQEIRKTIDPATPASLGNPLRWVRGPTGTTEPPIGAGPVRGVQQFVLR